MTAVAAVCNASSTAEAYEQYKCLSPLLKDYKFIFSTQKGAIPAFAVNHRFSAGASIRSLFASDRVFVLDAETFREMETGKATYPIDYSISLDTQALSYLEPYISSISSKPRSGIPSDFKEVFEFIARDDVRIDPIPYMSENLVNLADPNAADKIFNTFKAYEILRTLDIESFRKHGDIRSNLADYELVARAQQHLSQRYMDRENGHFMRGFSFMQQSMYALLLKMASIQLRVPSTVLHGKIAEFLKFCDVDLATMYWREIALARSYFEHGQKFAFFGKIQKKPNDLPAQKRRDDLLAQVSNMAWDLWHVRQMELMITFRPSKEARYFFSCLSYI